MLSRVARSLLGSAPVASSAARGAASLSSPVLLFRASTQCASAASLRAPSSVGARMHSLASSTRFALPSSPSSSLLSASPLLSVRAAASAAEAASAPLAAAVPRWVAPWLYTCSGLVFSMVVVGGVTRLTGSGLSMVDWSLHGGLPPMTQAEWETEFAKYQQFPEYKIAKSGMSLSEFKSIYFWEYSHRMFGRVIGLLYAAPVFYLLARRGVPWLLRKRLLYIGAMFGGQGLLGWYMVKSGLSHDTLPTHGEPRVSPYRLTAHLAAAVSIYSAMLWTAMSLQTGAQTARGALPPIRGAAIITASMTALTMVSGAFVAGNRAGLVYNEFPLMGGRFVPEDYSDMSPFWRNLTENLGAVQFNHRWLGIATLSAVLHTSAKAVKRGYRVGSVRLSVPIMALAGIAQVTLGISTLLTFVPVSLASMHQAGSMVLLSSALWLLRGLTRSPFL